MRAHVSASKRTRKEIDRLSHLAVEQERSGIIRRVFKVFCYTMHTRWGYGKERCLRVIDEMKAVFEEDWGNPDYWDEIDSYVIDFMKIPFEREPIGLDGLIIEK